MTQFPVSTPLLGISHLPVVVRALRVCATQLTMFLVDHENEEQTLVNELEETGSNYPIVQPPAAFIFANSSSL